MNNLINFNFPPLRPPRRRPPISREQSERIAKLHAAASSGNTDVCTELIQQDSSIINAKNSRHESALDLAASGGHVATINTLIASGANVWGGGIGPSPLERAAQAGHLAAVQVLLKKGADIEGNDTELSSPMAAACKEGHIEVVQALLQAGARVSSKDCAGIRPLHRAAGNNNPDLIRLLLDAGADPNLLPDDSAHLRTPIHEAAKAGHLETVKVLLAHGADPDGFRVRPSCCATVPAINHFPPISFAIMNDHPHVVAELVKSGADLKSPMKVKSVIGEIIDGMMDDLRNENLQRVNNDTGDNFYIGSLLENNYGGGIVVTREALNRIPGNLGIEGMQAQENIRDMENIGAMANVGNMVNFAEMDYLAEMENFAEMDAPIGIERAVDHSGYQRIVDKKVALYGTFGSDHPIFSCPMEPLNYSVLTEKKEIIGILMKSCKYSSNDISSLKCLADTHQLPGSLDAINSHSGFLPPLSLQVLSGRTIKKVLAKNHPCQELDSTMKKLDMPQNLHSFLQQSIYINL